MAESPKLTGMVEQGEKSKLAFWLFLGGEAVLFSSLILTLVVARVQHGGYADFKSHLHVPQVGLNTLVLIVSSFLVVRALAAIRRNHQAGLRVNLFVAILAGLFFLSGQAIEWAGLFSEGVSISDQYGTYFFTITGIHGTHVLIGVIWASFAIIRSLHGAFDADHAQGIEIFGLYWHFVDIVWIVLFTLFYLVS